VVAEAVAVGEEGPSVRFEKSGGRELARHASAVAGISPLCDGAENVGRHHGANLGPLEQRA
jgi:hypothetical protein